MSMLEMLGTQQNNGRATLGRTPIYRLTLSGEPLEVNVRDATITLGENMHDTVEMTVSSPDLTSTKGILDSPISFLYGSATKTEVFCGYVTDLVEQPNNSGAGVLTWTMGLTGPTKTMQLGVPRFWTQRTIPSAVETLSYLSYLGYTGHAHDHIWPALAQTEDSDWKMIVSLATRLGWSVYNRYGIVMLYDPLQLFVTQGPVAALISQTYNLAKDSAEQERSLLEFEPVEEAESSAPQRGYKVAYFSNNGVQVAMQKGDHASYRFLNDFVIRDPTEADIYVNSKESDSSAWAQTAKARVLGNANLFPGLSVDVMTIDQRFYTGKFNGRWLIRGVQHKMDKQTFQSNLMLARPSSSMQVFTGAYTPFWQSMTKARPTLTLSQTLTLPAPATKGIQSTMTAVDTPTVIPDSTNVWMSSWSNPSVRSMM